MVRSRPWRVVSWAHGSTDIVSDSRVLGRWWQRSRLERGLRMSEMTGRPVFTRRIESARNVLRVKLVRLSWRDWHVAGLRREWGLRRQILWMRLMLMSGCSGDRSIISIRDMSNLTIRERGCITIRAIGTRDVIGLRIKPVLGLRSHNGIGVRSIGRLGVRLRLRQCPIASLF